MDRDSARLIRLHVVRHALLLTTAGLLCLAMATPIVAAAASAPTNLSGNWNLTELWTGLSEAAGHTQTATYTIVQSSPGVYTVGNGAGWYTSDVAINGSSFTLWTCGDGGTFSNTDRSACPATSGYWLEDWNFDLTTNPWTVSGTFSEHLPDGTEGFTGTFTGYDATPQAAPALTVALSAQKQTLAIGAQEDVSATVTATGGDVTGITLGQGLVSSSDAVVVSKSSSGVSNFDLSNGSSKTFTFTVMGAEVGSAELRITASGTTTSGAVGGPGTFTLTVVPGSPLKVSMSVTPSDVQLNNVPADVTSPGGAPVVVTVTVKNTGKSAVSHLFLESQLVIGYNDGDPVIPVVPLRQNGKPSPTGDLGKLAAGATSKPVTYKLLAKGDGGYSIEALASAEPSTGGVVHGLGKGSVSVKTPYLSFDTELTTDTSQGGALWGVGVPYTVDVNVQNLSYRKSIVFFPEIATQGNAQAGAMIAPDAEIPQQDTQSTAQACAPPQAIQLAPREEKEFKLVIYSSTAGAAVLGATGGGTRSVVVVNTPEGGIVNDNGDGIASQLSNNQIVMSGDDRMETSLSDPGILAYSPTDYDPPILAVTKELWVAEGGSPDDFDPAYGGLAIAQGFLTGVGSLEYGFLHGIFVDLPKLIPAGFVALMQLEANLYTSLKEDPVSFATALTDPVTSLIKFSAENAPALSSWTSNIASQVNSSIDRYFGGIANQYYAGDWKAALKESSAAATESVIGVASLSPSFIESVATCVLPRAKLALQALAETRNKVFVAAAEQLGDLADNEPAVVAATKFADLPSGMPLTYKLIEKLAGYSKEQIDYLRNFVVNNPTGKKLLLTLRTRAPQALEWLSGKTIAGVKWAGALLKPEQFKIKSVSWLDAQVLGYSLNDIGRVVLRRPISEADLRANLLAADIPATVIDAANGKTVTNPTWSDAFKLLKQRVGEYLHARDGFTSGSGGYYRDIVDAAKQGKMTLRWNLEDNSFTSGFSNGFNTYPFRLATEGDVAIPVSQLDTFAGTMIPEFFINGKWRCITGDADFLTMTTAESTPLNAADRFALNSDLASSPIGMLHPPADTWTSGDDFWFGAKENEFNRAGNVLQFAPDGNVYVVKYDAADSWWTSADDYHVGFTDGYVAPLQAPGG